MNKGRGKRRLLLALCLLGTLLFTSLGIWQLERRTWKLALIDRVNTRLAATPVPAPPPARWKHLDAAAEEYRRVQARGTFLHERETLVDALTEQGPGFWVMTPLQVAGGFILINRGFVPPDKRQPEQRAAGQVSGETVVTGLLRPSEPNGRFLRANRPGENRWFSRDVQAIAQARGLQPPLAPFFIDADATANSGGYPVGGLTVVRFRNTHLIYALTWFGLAALSLTGIYLLSRHGRRA